MPMRWHSLARACHAPPLQDGFKDLLVADDGTMAFVLELRFHNPEPDDRVKAAFRLELSTELESGLRALAALRDIQYSYRAVKREVGGWVAPLGWDVQLKESTLDCNGTCLPRLRHMPITVKLCHYGSQLFPFVDPLRRSGTSCGTRTA